MQDLRTMNTPEISKPALASESPVLTRRRLLQLGAGAAAVLVVAGGAAALWRSGLREGQLTASGRDVFRAIALGVLDGSLPPEEPARTRAIDAHLQRLDLTLAGLSSTAQSELSQLLAVLNLAAGRRFITTLPMSWSEASVDDVQIALRHMRQSTRETTLQTYHALRDLTNSAYFCAPETWAAMGYPGPTDI